MSGRRFAIVGGGYSGALLAGHLLARGAAGVTLIERSGPAGRGVAYGTREDAHLLNVPAARMSAFADRPDDFADWYARHGGAPDGFAPRRLYGAYLEEIVSGLGPRLTVIAGEAVDVVARDGGETVVLADGRRIAADAAVLAVGNFPPAPLAALSEAALPGLYVADPWAGDFAAGLGPGEDVLLIGTGLTAIDAALTLEARGFAGRILALSRRGLKPRAHAPFAASPPPPDDLPAGLSLLLRTVRRDAARIGWRGAVDRLRPVTQVLWAAAPRDVRRRFLRHLRPWWDVHRHRIAPAVATRIAAMEAEGRLRFAAGRILSVIPGHGKARIAWRARGETERREWLAARIVNCTGPEGDIARADDRLMAGLVAAGRIRPDPLGIGIAVDDDLRALGRDGIPADTLLIAGPMTRGALWEIVAVPDLRVQIAALADRLCRA